MIARAIAIKFMVVLVDDFLGVLFNKGVYKTGVECICNKSSLTAETVLVLLSLALYF